MKKHFEITQNTDNVDIDQKCLGLCVRRPSIPKDVMDHISSNRGLHIQIRHNRDSQTFAQASELSKLLTAAPDLLQACKAALITLNADEYRQECIETVETLEAAIERAERG